MHRTARLAVLFAALLSLPALAASTAGAVTWHNSGSTTFTATSGPTTLSSTSATVGCTSTDVTGTVPSLLVGLTLVATGNAQFTGCSLGGLAVTVHCSYTMTGTSWTAGKTTGNADATCFTSQFGALLCITEGPIAGSYVNPPSVGTATLNASSTLRSTNPGGGATCPLGNGDPLTLTANTAFTITSANSPSITRTA